MDKLKLIQCGVGGMGRAWWKNATRDHVDFDLVAIVDPAEKTLHECGDELNIPKERRFKSLEEAIGPSRADAVLTVTPPIVHWQHAKRAFEHGLHLLTEKPLADTLEHAKEMVQLAREHGRQLVVGQNRRYLAGNVRFKQALDEANLGNLGHGHCDFYIPADFTGTFRETMQFPLLIDMAIHHIDLLRFFTGKNVLSVTAQSFKPSWSWFQHDPGLKMLMELEGGIAFSYSGDWTARGRCTSWNGDWRLNFADGSMHLESDKIARVTCEKWIKNQVSTPIEIPPMQNELKSLLDTFAQAIRTGKPAPTNGADNLHSLATVFAGVKSAQEKRTVQVAELLG